MTREEAKELLPAITHFANGGNLWYYTHHNKIWNRQCSVILSNLHDQNIIEDKHFEARKAFSLGEEVEYLINGRWKMATNISDNPKMTYRPKSKEVYEWQWYYENNGRYILTREHYGDEHDKGKELFKFEPSKRKREC